MNASNQPDSNLRNVRLLIAYDGTEYVGWQVQPNGLSVQEVVEAAIFKLTGENVRVTAASRTDSGVHALGQVANFHTASNIPCANVRTGLQNFLPDDVIIRDVHDVPSDFHATYSTRRKRYRYVIHNSRISNPFVRRYAWQHGSDISLEAMQQGASYLLGKHDFRCFESHYPNKATSVRTIEEARFGRAEIWPIWSRTDEISKPIPDSESGEFFWFDIVADGFLYNMVRAIVGTLMQVGLGRWEPGQIQQIIAGQDRSQAGETAPAHGLYLVHVDYEDDSLEEASSIANSAT